MTDETILKLAKIICDCIFWTAVWCAFWVCVDGGFTKAIANTKKKGEE